RRAPPALRARPAAGVMPPLLGGAEGESVGPVENVSTGRPIVFVMLKTLGAMKGARVVWGKLTGYFAGGDGQRGIYLLTRETLEAGYAVHARKLTARLEDPATGSAAGCAAASLVKQGVVRSGEVVKVEQGHLMGRPSELLLSAVKGAGGEVDEVRVGGRSVLVLEGKVVAKG
ncbi:MAG: PhzF family phenazine biosynthesis protein, partial [Acidobacteriota bacterium]